MSEEILKNINFVPMDDATTPKSGMFSVYVDSWWAVNEKNELLFYKPYRNSWGSPQCNSNERTAKHLHKKLYPEFKTVKIPVVYCPIDPSDYVC